MSNQFLIILGNPVDGYNYVGPFASSDEANDWGERNEAKYETEWWITCLVTPLALRLVGLDEEPA